MITPPISSLESQRLQALDDYQILDTAEESIFDDLTQLAAHICQTPIALISLIDESRQWFKSKVGVTLCETPRDISFCAHTIAASRLLEVPNALEDMRFFDNPLVLAEPHIRFYAGMPLLDKQGFALGTLCVIDSRPRQLSCEQREALAKLARQVVSHIEHRMVVQKIAKLHQQQLESTHFIQAITDAMPAMVGYWDAGLYCRFANQAYKEWFGKVPADIIGNSMIALLGESLFAINRPYIEAALVGQSQCFERTLLKPDGTAGQTLISYIPDINPQGSVSGFFVLCSDVTSIKKAESDLKLAASVFENTSEGILVTDDAGIILSVNPAFCQLLGYQALEVIGHNASLLQVSLHDTDFYQQIRRTLDLSGIWQGELWLAHKSGSLCNVIVAINCIAKSDGTVTHYVMTMLDNTQNKLHEQRRLQEEAAHRDALVREVHHRIKNNLHGVMGILRNYAQQNPVCSEPLHMAISQVQSIAVIHGLQGKHSASIIELAELVTAISRHLESLWQITISLKLDMQDCYITPTEAVPLALVLNELISNAIKHRVANTPVHIALCSDTDGAKFSLSNMGCLSQNCQAQQPIAGSGLQLVASLLPRKGADLSWRQEADKVITQLLLSPPTLLLNAATPFSQN